MKWKSIIWSFLLWLNLFWFGAYIYEKYCFSWLPMPEGIAFTTTDIGTHFSNSVWFGLACSSIFIFIPLIFRVTKTTQPRVRIFAFLFVVILMIAAWYIRIIMLSSVMLEYAAQIKQWGSDFVGNIDVSNFHFASFIFSGAIVGCAISYVVLTRVNSSKKKDQNLQSAYH